jgi:transcriptional regulator with XRE-family HTH domain
MNQEKIGKFIADCRKDKKITQAQLAEKLNMTDRAISKWETGNGMPDSSVMLELCEILEITVNELLSGERLEMDNYDKRAEENLIKLKSEEENSNKKFLFFEKVLGFESTIAFMLLLLAASFATTNLIWRIVLFSGAFLILITGISFALKIETEAGYYECQICHNRYVPKYTSVYFAMHNGMTRYMKCPKCGKRSWNKKVLSK